MTTIHLGPDDGSSQTRCCDRNAHELLGDRMTYDTSLVTCPAYAPTLSTEMRALRGELGVWKDEALRRRDAMRDAALAVHETTRIAVLDTGRVHVRLPSRDVYLSAGQTMVVRGDGTYVTEWEAS